MATSGSSRPPLSPQERENAPVVDVEGQVGWISEQSEIPSDVVQLVLELEFDFMVAVGIVDLPSYEPRFYEPAELEGTTAAIVDPARLVEDAQLFLGIPADVANIVFDAEDQFFRMRGLITE